MRVGPIEHPGSTPVARAASAGRDRRLRVALFAPQFPEYSLEYALAMSRHCAMRVVVDARQFEAEYGGRRVDLSALPEVRLVDFRDARAVLGGIAWLLRSRPDIVHIQEPAGPRKLLLGALLTALARPFARVVLGIHDPEPHAGADAIVARRSTWVRRWLRGRASAVVVHGPHCGQAYRRSRPPAHQRVIVSSHGLILRPAEPAAPTDEGVLRLLFFGRMQAYKGLATLLEAVRMLDRDGVPFRLVIAGAGEELDRLGPAFAQLAQVEVRAGYLPSDALIELVRSCHCVVLPYLGATQSGVLAAAFAGGRFVVASRVGGLQDVVRHMDNGLLVPPGDAAALADALRLASADTPLRGRLCRGARNTAETVLDWAVIAQSLHARFDELCGRQRPTP